MAIEWVTVLLECDECGHDSEFDLVDLDQRDLRQKAEADEWEYEHGRWLCPGCVYEYQRDAEEEAEEDEDKEDF